MDRCIKVYCRVRPVGAQDLSLGAHEDGREFRKSSPEGSGGGASRESTPTNGIEDLQKHDAAGVHFESGIGLSASRCGDCSITTRRADVSGLLTPSDGTKVAVMHGAVRASGRRRERHRWGFTFDDVLENGCKQEEVYRRCASDIVDSVLAGVNGTVMACKWSIKVYLSVCVYARMSSDRYYSWQLVR